MAVSAKFLADFSSFEQAVSKAELKLTEFRTSAGDVEKSLKRMGDSFSGKRILSDAALAVKAVQDLGGVSKLTTQEQSRLHATVSEAIAKYKALGQSAPSDMRAVEKATRAAAESTSTLSTGMIAVGTAIGTFLGNLAVTAVKALGREMLDLATNGIKLAPVVSSFEKLTASIGETADVMINTTRTATKGLISDLDIMQAANKAVLLGLPVTAQEFGVLGQAAVALGRAMGQNAAQSLNDLITALGRSSPMILDNLGLTVKVGEANDLYAAKVGKTAEQLTDAEKKLAFYNAAMDAAKQKVSDLGGIQLTLADQIQRARTVMTNFTDALGVAIARSPVLSGVLGDLAGNLEAAFGGNQVSRIQDLIGVVNTVSLKLFDVGQAAIVVADVIYRAMKAAVAPVFALASAVTSVALAIQNARAASLNFSASVPLIGKSFKGVADSAQSSADFLKGFQQGLHDEAVAAGEAVLGHSAFKTTLDGLSTSLSAMQAKAALAAKTQADSAGIASDLANRMKLGGDATANAGAQTKAYTDALAALQAKFSGSGVLKTAEQYETTLKAIGGASRLTNSETVEFIKVFQSVIDKYKAMGPAGAAVVAHFQQLTDTLTAQLEPALLVTAERMNDLAFGAGKMLSTLPDDISRAAVAFEDLASRVPNVSDLMFGPKGIASQSISSGIPLLGETLGKQITRSLQASLRGLPNLLLSALTGGGGFKGFGQALASDIGGGLTQNLFAAGGVLNNFANSATKGVSKIFGNAVGDIFGSFLPGIGSLIGPAISGIGKLFGKLFGGEGKKVNDLRDQFISSAGGINKLAEAARQAGTSVDALLKANKVKDFDKAVSDLQAKLGLFTSEQEADAQRLTAAVEKYGFTFEQLGPALQKQNLDAQAKELIEDWRVLVGAGVDLGVVNEKMASTINDYLAAAIKTGTEVPNALRPILQKMAEQGLLTDEAGNAITDLESSGIKFAETMTEGFDRVVEKLNELIERLGAAGTEMDKVINKNASGLVDGDQGWHSGIGSVSGGQALPGFARGTGGRFVNFGTGTLAMLHGREAVVPEGQAAGGGSSAVVAALERLSGDLHYRDSILPYQLRDAVLRAR